MPIKNPPGGGGSSGSLATWTSGSGVPSGGNNGDYYLRTSNGDVYLKSAGSWSVVANMAGPTGATGAAGATGATGATGPSGLTDYVMVSDRKTQNTQGGTFTAGAWRTRDINTEDSDTGGHCSISSNQITLAAGTYRFRASACAWATNRNQLRLQNITDGTTLGTGVSNFSSNTAGMEPHAHIVCKFTLATSKVLEIQHQCEATSATYGLGMACNFTTECYTIAEFWKE